MKVPRLPSDIGAATLSVRFRAKSGRVRTLTRPIVFR